MELGELAQKLFGVSADYWLTRYLFQRALGLTYLIAFLVVIFQFRPLLGERGLLPVPTFVENVRFWSSPSLFFAFPKDWAVSFLGWLGLILAIGATIGLSEHSGRLVSALVWGLLWLIYLSFVNVGQTFYSFGWESLLLEAGFLAIFLGDAKTAPSVITIFLIRWILFRLMFGAGLIKWRGDSCWRDLTCLVYQHETQPMPNPLSWYFHQLPVGFHKISVLYNHFAELIVPFFYFAPAPLSTIAGFLTLLLHGTLFVSGNYAFLGFLTMVLTIPVFNDRFWLKIIPLAPVSFGLPSLTDRWLIGGVLVMVAMLSIKPIVNMISPRQIMNTSFDPLHLVNTYGAFGSVTRERYEIVIEATQDHQITDQTVWQEYEFKGKPGDVNRSPPQVAPYHRRLDWLMWFEGIYADEGQKFGQYRLSPWFLNFIAKLLVADQMTLSLVKSAPFGSEQPKFVRALVYHYQFTSPKERQESQAIWKRKLIDTYLPPVSLTNQPFLDILKKFGWEY